MKQQFHYATVTEAVEQLKNQGYTLEFSLKDNHCVAGDEQYPAGDFEITDLYRYEGASDPADEATVYALANASGTKGILVSGYGVSADDVADETLKRLHYKYQRSKQ